MSELKLSDYLPFPLLTIDDFAGEPTPIFNEMLGRTQPSYDWENDEQKTLRQLPKYQVLLQYAMGIYGFDDGGVNLKALELLEEVFPARNENKKRLWTPSTFVFKPYLAFDDENGTLYYD